MAHEPASTNDPPRRALSRIIAKHGRGICDAPKRVEALLRDLCGGHRREINIIMGAHEERVPADLMAAGNSVPRDVLLARLAARLRDNLAYTPEAARWGVETWALALGVLSEAELRERELGRAEEAGRGAATAPVRDSPPPARQTGGGPQAPGPQRGTAYAPPQSQTSSRPQPAPPKPTPPTPPIFNPPPSAPRRAPYAPPNVTAPAPPVRNFPPAPAPRSEPRRGLKLRSCLILIALVVALIVAAVFAIPAVIVLLQEEQSRPSINDPRVR